MTVLTALSNLSSAVSGGTYIVFTNAGVTVNESTGQLETILGVATRVFNLTAYSANNATVLTMAGDGAVTPSYSISALAPGNSATTTLILAVLSTSRARV